MLACHPHHGEVRERIQTRADQGPQTRISRDFHPGSQQRLAGTALDQAVLMWYKGLLPKLTRAGSGKGGRRQQAKGGFSQLIILGKGWNIRAVKCKDTSKECPGLSFQEGSGGGSRTGYPEGLPFWEAGNRAPERNPLVLRWEVSQR